MFRRKNIDGSIGSVDGGEGRGIPLGGTDRRPPTGYRNVDDLDDDEVITTADALDDYDDFADHGDSHPDDRRRDPLRR